MVMVRANSLRVNSVAGAAAIPSAIGKQAPGSRCNASRLADKPSSPRIAAFWTVGLPTLARNPHVGDYSR